MRIHKLLPVRGDEDDVVITLHRHQLAGWAAVSHSHDSGTHWLLLEREVGAVAEYHFRADVTDAAAEIEVRLPHLRETLHALRGNVAARAALYTEGGQHEVRGRLIRILAGNGPRGDAALKATRDEVTAALADAGLTVDGSVELRAETPR